MISKSALENIHSKGQFGDYEDKQKKDLIEISELKDLLIVQLVQFKNSSASLNSIEIDNLKLSDVPLNVSSNDKTRILWSGPKNWLLVSYKKNLMQNLLEVFKESDFAITDLSHSRAVFELEGKNVKEVLKKGCPFNFDNLKKNNSVNSTYHGIAFTGDMLEDNPEKIRLFTLRSFGESFYHSITDSSLEYGYIAN
jgi:heterotetrameric sarcosine oxidase gamma subunit